MELMTEEKIGFKRTDVGLIPVDWYLKSLIEIGAFSKGKGIKKSEVKSQGIPCVRYGELYTKHHEQINEFHSFIDENVAKQSRKLSKGDILFAGSGETKKEIGKCVAFNLNVEAYAGGDIVILSPSGVDSNFLGYALNSEIANEQKYQRAQGDAVVHIYSSSLSNLKIPLPPTLAEQQVIASALSDVDELIRSLDGLIQKKQAIKKGTMQQLLTGKKRLPGFDGEWEVKKLGDMTSLITKGTTPTSLGKAYTDRGISFIKAESIDKAGNVIKDKTAFIDEDTNNLLKRSILHKNDIMFSIAGVLGRTSIIKEDYLPANTNQALAIIRLGNDTDISYQYLFHFLRSEQIEKHVQDINVQAAQANLSLKDVSEFQIEVPPTIEEQKQIVQILSDMERELQTLRQKREKYVQIKQGMMQELLMGRTRLV